MEKWKSRVAKHTLEDTQDSGVQFIIPARPRGIGSEQGPRDFQETRFYTPHWVSVYMFGTFFDVYDLVLQHVGVWRTNN